MSDSLFYLLFAVVIGLFLSARRRQRRAVLAASPELSDGARRGPVPGYSYLPGSLMTWDPTNPPPGIGEKWEPVSLETLHAGRRTRLVLTIRTDESQPTERFSMMGNLAGRIMARTPVQVLAIEIEGSGHRGSEVMITARNGRGWTGTGLDAPVTVDLADRKSFRMETM